MGSVYDQETTAPTDVVEREDGEAVSTDVTIDSESQNLSATSEKEESPFDVVNANFAQLKEWKPEVFTPIAPQHLEVPWKHSSLLGDEAPPPPPQALEVELFRDMLDAFPNAATIVDQVPDFIATLELLLPSLEHGLMRISRQMEENRQQEEMGEQTGNVELSSIAPGAVATALKEWIVFCVRNADDLDLNRLGCDLANVCVRSPIVGLVCESGLVRDINEGMFESVDSLVLAFKVLFSVATSPNSRMRHEMLKHFSFPPANLTLALIGEAMWMEMSSILANFKDLWFSLAQLYGDPFNALSGPTMYSEEFRRPLVNRIAELLDGVERMTQKIDCVDNADAFSNSNLFGLLESWDLVEWLRATAVRCDSAVINCTPLLSFTRFLCQNPSGLLLMASNYTAAEALCIAVRNTEICKQIMQEGLKAGGMHQESCLDDFHRKMVCLNIVFKFGHHWKEFVAENAVTDDLLKALESVYICLQNRQLHPVMIFTLQHSKCLFEAVEKLHQQKSNGDSDDGEILAKFRHLSKKVTAELVTWCYSPSFWSSKTNVPFFKFLAGTNFFEKIGKPSLNRFVEPYTTPVANLYLETASPAIEKAFIGALVKKALLEHSLMGRMKSGKYSIPDPKLVSMFRLANAYVALPGRATEATRRLDALVQEDVVNLLSTLLLETMLDWKEKNQPKDGVMMMNLLRSALVFILEIVEIRTQKRLGRRTFGCPSDYPLSDIISHVMLLCWDFFEDSDYQKQLRDVIRQILVVFALYLGPPSTLKLLLSLNEAVVKKCRRSESALAQMLAAILPSTVNQFVIGDSIVNECKEERLTSIVAWISEFLVQNNGAVIRNICKKANGDAQIFPFISRICSVSAEAAAILILSLMKELESLLETVSPATRDDVVLKIRFMKDVMGLPSVGPIVANYLLPPENLELRESAEKLIHIVQSSNDDHLRGEFALFMMEMMWCEREAVTIVQDAENPYTDVVLWIKEFSALMTPNPNPAHVLETVNLTDMSVFVIDVPPIDQSFDVNSALLEHKEALETQICRLTLGMFSQTTPFTELHDSLLERIRLLFQRSSDWRCMTSYALQSVDLSVVFANFAVQLETRSAANLLLNFLVFVDGLFSEPMSAVYAFNALHSARVMGELLKLFTTLRSSANPMHERSTQRLWQLVRHLREKGNVYARMHGSGPSNKAPLDFWRSAATQLKLGYQPGERSVPHWQFPLELNMNNFLNNEVKQLREGMPEAPKRHIDEQIVPDVDQEVASPPAKVVRPDDVDEPTAEP